jgi:alkylated DNA nucleotide flippase Atl1
MQQLLDKWERLRTSEYLRPDEKLMLNHCISDLKRFMDHSGDVNEMVGNRTAVEWLISQLQQTRDWQRVINEANQSSTSVRDVIEQAKEMEKEQIKDAFGVGCQVESTRLIGYHKMSEQYYNETYGGNK